MSKKTALIAGLCAIQKAGPATANRFENRLDGHLPAVSGAGRDVAQAVMEPPQYRFTTDWPAITEDLCCAAIAGKPAAWPAQGEDALAAVLLETAKAHGVDMLLHHALQRHPDTQSWPGELRQELKRRHYAFAAEEMLLAGELQKLLDAFGAVGIRPLLMKGEALARSHYPESSCRPRCDTDMLFAAGQMHEVKKLLHSLGYTFPNAVSGELVSSQQTACRPLANRLFSALDLHWKINNLPLLGDAFDYATAKSKAHALPALGENAFALCPVHALLLACVHRAGHLRETFVLHGKTVSQGDRLIWLHDIHLLLSAMTEAETTEFIALARGQKMRAICRDAIERTRQRFATTVPGDLAAALSTEGETEPSSRYLSSGSRSRLANTLLDMGLVPDFAGRLRLLREYLLPPADYMLRKYRFRQRYLLPFLYLWRILSGIGKGLRR
jgi:hypothetical protein